MTVQELYENIGGSIQSALRILQMDKMVARFIVRYLDEPSCGKLLEAYENKDEKGVFEAAHAMKGVCANLGLTGLSEAASEIAEEYRPGKERRFTDAEVKAKIDHIAQDYQKTAEEIQKYENA